ncbi:hypothetical protein PIB30_053262 [Stylosanthes scabra]|uniref:TCP domain-containing protein n=1 Tax=Stylosanthes scabra TaxID=79078 RepID=A0ABU6QJB5_9FABA|nr:hypothetical protein [Stylosanthes scabra]
MKDPSDFPLKQETDHHHQHEKPSSSAAAAKASTISSSSSSSQWLRLKDPRIVRVSRAFGGKDRHSKVCTIRGLRDRRVRLSVPTAIQLYDLQDRLGLNQPSKVVDWLLNAAKHEIDELPPLPNITNPFTLPGSSSMIINTNNNNEGSTSMFNINRSIHQWQGLAQSYSKWNNNNKSKSSSSSFTKQEDNNQMVITEEDKEEEEEEDEEGAANVVSNNTNNHHPSFLGLLNTMPIAGNYQFEAHNNDVNVAQLGNHHHHGFITNQTDLQSINVVPFPSTLSLSTQSYFPSHSSSEAAMEDNNNMHQMLTTSHHHLHQNLFTNNNLPPSFSLAMMSTPILLHHPHPNTRESSTQSHHHHKHHHFPSSK